MDTTEKIGGEFSPGALWSWAAALFKSPRAFFGAMEKRGGYGAPILYILSWAFASGVISFLVSLARPAPAGAGRGLQAAGIVAGPIVGLLFAFVAAGALFVIWHL